MMLQHGEPPIAGATGDDRPSRLAETAPASEGFTVPLAYLVDEFSAAWQRGDCPAVEVFFERLPWLSAQPEAAIRLIYEEVCLRRSDGQDVRLSELVNRFPRWETELGVLLDCDRLVGAVADSPAFPSVGETLGEFVLVAELGRGGRGRCFLADQPSLSHRKVVVKVTPDDLVEHLSLARLQHTHIMPLYSEHEFPARRLRALCMPYLGGETLARIRDEFHALPTGRWSGQSLLDVLDRGRQPSRSPWPHSLEGPSRQFVARSTYIHTVCWIGACLADALQYAHERGLTHMDVKPSNILLTADCQPMLLDFHLASAPISVGDPLVTGLGGTPGYMSPEQEAAVKAIGRGKPVTTAVDARSDLYSLACVLAEMLAFKVEDAGADDAEPVRRYLPGVSTGLVDLIRKCQSADPNDRYPTAAVLADDLRRHMADMPLRGVANRNLRERWQKWRRRQRYEFFRVKTMVVAMGAVVVIAAVIWGAFLAPRVQYARQALLEGRGLLSRHDYPEAARALIRGTALIEGIPGGERLSRELAEARRALDQVQQAARLHQIVESLRFAEAAAIRPDPSARELEWRCRALWESRSMLMERAGTPGDADLTRRLRHDLLDLAVIGSNLRVGLETDAMSASVARRAALTILNEAERVFGPGHVLYRARQIHARALGLSSVAELAARGAAQVPPRTAWEHDAVGRVLLAAGEFALAEAAFERALALEPQNLWPNFHQGVCVFRLGRYSEAVSAFRVCVALAPDRAECIYNRAMARAALGQNEEAAIDFARAYSLDPTLERSHRNRSLEMAAPSRASGVGP